MPEEPNNTKNVLSLKNIHVRKSLLPVFIFHRYPLSSHYPTCNPSIFLPDSLSARGLNSHQRSTSLHPFFLSLNPFPSLFYSPIHSTHTKLITTQLNLYGNSKPLILRVRQGEMLAAIKPQNCSMSNQTQSLPCATVGSLISNEGKLNLLGNPLVIKTTTSVLVHSTGK